jgi:hypothetical protein
MQLYRCNKADDPRCPSCQHNEPHERWSFKIFGQSIFGDKGKGMPDVCTDWADCNDVDGKLIFKVRCIKVK